MYAPRTDYDRAKLLVEAVQELSTDRTVSQIQATVRSAARELMGADGATFVLRGAGERCQYVDEDAIAPLWKGQDFAMEACVSGGVMQSGAPVRIPDIYQDDRVPLDAYRVTFVHSLAMVPIRQTRPIGAIGVYWATNHDTTDEELDLLQALADSTSVAMENARMLEELEQARLETLQRLALAGEFRDDETFQHTQRVAYTSALLAAQLGLPDDQVDLIEQAAALHDIGKLAVPDAILLKPGRLTDAEFEQMKGHPSAGAAMLDGSHSGALKLAAEIALSHHEHWDGSGYPWGTAEEEIPLSARIVTVADVFDSLTHERPYKHAWPVADSVAEIHRLRGLQFDPDVIAAFTSLDPSVLVDGNRHAPLRLVA
ncbi:MAG: HD domain-containing protein [Solirubrobacteraceae bacterium]|nr:HD domain-containing protein [Solirubrobacteraceae bacterium]